MATKKKTATKTAKKTAAARKAAARPAAAAKKPRARQFSEKQLRAMLNMLLNQYAEQVKDGAVRLTPSEGFKLMQMQESLGLLKPSGVKVEWVEPKE